MSLPSVHTGPWTNYATKYHDSVITFLDVRAFVLISAMTLVAEWLGKPSWKYFLYLFECRRRRATVLVPPRSSISHNFDDEFLRIIDARASAFDTALIMIQLLIRTSNSLQRRKKPFLLLLIAILMLFGTLAFGVAMSYALTFATEENPQVLASEKAVKAACGCGTLDSMTRQQRSGT